MMVTLTKNLKEKKRAIKRRFKFNDYKDCLLNNEIILKSKQRFKSEAHNVYTEEINKIVLSSNDDKRLQTFDRITSYPYNVSYECWKSMQNRIARTSKYKMTNFDDYTNENKTDHNLKWSYIPDHPYRTLIMESSWSEKTNSLL